MNALQAAPCCGKPPTLRVKPLDRAGAVIPYVQYECRLCGNTSGLGITENEAWMYWSPKNAPAFGDPSPIDFGALSQF